MAEINTPLLHSDRTFTGQRSASPAPSEPSLVRPAAGSPEGDSEHAALEAQSDDQASYAAAAEGRRFEHPVLMAVWLSISFISLVFFVLASMTIAVDTRQVLILLVEFPAPCCLMGTLGGIWYFYRSFTSRLSTNLAAQIKVIHRLATATLILSFLSLATPIYYIINLTIDIRKGVMLGWAVALMIIAVLVLIWMIGYVFLCSAIVHKTTLANARLS